MMIDDSWVDKIVDWVKENNYVHFNFSNEIRNQTISRELCKNKLLNLKSLSLEGHGRGDGSEKLTEIPAEIGNLYNLETLKIKYINTKKIPKEIGNLTNLTWLIIKGNSFDEIPVEIGDLINLTSLTITNKLKKIPKEIGKLTNLTSLDLAHCRQKRIPKEIGKLTNLTRLCLRVNNITELPKEIGKLTNLTSLDLAHCRLKRIPKEIHNLLNLKAVTFRDNPMVLTEEDEKWIRILKENCGKVGIDLFVQM